MSSYNPYTPEQLAEIEKQYTQHCVHHISTIDNILTKYNIKHDTDFPTKTIRYTDAYEHECTLYCDSDGMEWYTINHATGERTDHA